MTEAEWVEHIRERIASSCFRDVRGLEVKVGLKVPYGLEITAYGNGFESSAVAFETDLAIIEKDSNGHWKPRVVIEAKMRTVTSHDAITYSHKAAAHKAVHPYLRYGIMLGERLHYPLPGRLYRHGAHFDFMISFVSTEASDQEMQTLVHLLQIEIEASRTLECQRRSDYRLIPVV